MIQTVLKRDGRVVGFNEEKIVAAVRRAMLIKEKICNWHMKLPIVSLAGDRSR